MYKSRKTTWSKNTHKWLKTIGVDTRLTQEEIVNTVRTARQNNFARQTNTIANNQAIELNIKSSKLIRTTQFTKKCHHMGINALVRIRMGTFCLPNILSEPTILNKILEIDVYFVVMMAKKICGTLLKSVKHFKI
ncbi:hypothetical protein GVAV_002951 [Gurleya vavrai]